MSSVRVLVGTRKGAFVLSSDGARKQWDVSGPHFAGWEIYHVKGSPADPNRIYASQSIELVRPGDTAVGRWRKDLAAGRQSVHLRRRARHAPVVRRNAPPVGVQAGLAPRTVGDEPDTVLAGVEDAALFKSTDGGQTWKELSGLRGHGSGPSWAPGAGGLCLHTIMVQPDNPARMYIAISAAGAFRTDDGGASWQAINQGLTSQHIPDPTAEVGHCVHRIAMHRSRPNVLFMQKHWDVMRSDNGGDSWREISGNLPTDFGFAMGVHAHEPETVYVVPIKSDSEHFPPDGKLRVYRSRSGGNEWEALTNGLPQQDCYVNVLRGAMAIDSLDSCGVYFGTTGGQVYASADSGESWAPIVRDLPAVLSVEVQTL